MKFIFSIALCLFLGWNASGQITADYKRTAAGIKEISLAKDDGKGNIGEITGSFLTTDTPIHFIIQLDSMESVTVKMNLIAVKAVGMKPETKSIDVSFTTNGKQSQVNFDASPSGLWAAGNYRADIFLNGKLAESCSFDIEKSPNEPEPKKSVPAKNFAPRKKTRKN